MTPKRRSFLQLAGLAPAAAVGLVAAPAVRAAASPPSLTRSAFAAHIGEDFVFEIDALTTRTARLAKVDSLPHARDGEASFRLLFRVGAEAPGLPQETYAVVHPVVGRAAIFVSPNDAEGRLVEAVFNRG